MNYIKEINAFYDWLEINELSTSAVALWHALMHINNKAAWVETFTVAESVLSVKTKLSGRTIRDARNELKQRGRIDFRSRSGGKAPMYTIISFETGINVLKKSPAQTAEELAEINSEEKPSTENTAGDSAGDSAEGNAGDSSGDSATLNKLNKTKLNETIYSSTTIPPRGEIPPDLWEVKTCFEHSGFGTVSFNILESLNAYIEIYSKEWVIEALKEADRQNKRNLKYVHGILQNWRREGGMKLGQQKDKLAKKVTHYFNNYSGQRQYNMDELEQLLLGRVDLEEG